MDRAFDADIVVFRLGENVASQNKPYFKETMKRFIEYICPHGTVIYTTCFWNNPIVDEAIKCVAVERGELCIDGCFSNNKDNMALGQFNHRAAIWVSIIEHNASMGYTICEDKRVAKNIVVMFTPPLQSPPAQGKYPRRVNCCTTGVL